MRSGSSSSTKSKRAKSAGVARETTGVGEHLLTAEQRSVLRVFAGARLAKAATFCGGTALSAVHLGHRYSDDVDFFCPEVGTAEVADLVRRLRSAGFEVTQRQKLAVQFLDLTAAAGARLRVDLIYHPPEPIEPPLSWRGLRVESLKDLAVAKLMALLDRIEAKDFVDLYFILKARADLDFAGLAALARIKYDANVDRHSVGSRLLAVSELGDFPRMAKRLTRAELRAFYERHARALALMR